MILVSRTALIVDDSRSARVVLKRVLETHDLDVDTAESAEDAIDYLVDHRPNVIFMDHLMPGIDGFEAISTIKKNPETATIPIMMYTSKKGEVYVGQARALGAIGVLPKDVAPVEVAKVLKSLHIIGDEKLEQSGDRIPTTPAINDEIAPHDIHDQDLKILIQDLFEQQWAIIQRDLLDSSETIAARIAEEIRPSPPENSVELQMPKEMTSSGIMTSSVVMLSVFVLVFAWLYWQEEQDWQKMRAQNIELQQVLQTQRIFHAEELQRALESQRITDTEMSMQVLKQMGEYQQSLDAIYSETINSLEWGANQASEYHFGEMPLGNDRLKVVEQLTEHLFKIGFSGVVRIETHVANYCLEIAGLKGYTPALDRMVVECDRIGATQEEAYQMGLGQTVAFADFIRLAEERSGGQIRYEIISLGNTDPILDYPLAIEGVSASKWNQIAAVNNRVLISISPESY